MHGRAQDGLRARLRLSLAPVSQLLWTRKERDSAKSITHWAGCWIPALGGTGYSPCPSSTCPLRWHRCSSPRLLWLPVCTWMEILRQLSPDPEKDWSDKSALEQPNKNCSQEKWLPYFLCAGSHSSMSRPYTPGNSLFMLSKFSFLFWWRALSCLSTLASLSSVCTRSKSRLSSMCLEFA